MSKKYHHLTLDERTLIQTQVQQGFKLGAYQQTWRHLFGTLLIHGARAALRASVNRQDRRSQWAQSLATRRNRNIAIVALANKNARIAWAVLSREEAYRGAPQKASS